MLLTPFGFKPAEVISRYEELSALCTGFPVISHEDLAGHIYSGGFNKRETADRLALVFPRAKVLITIREQASLILSAYHYFLWDGGLCSLRQFVTPSYSEFQLPLFNPAHLRYDQTVGYYRALFGMDNVLVLALEDFVSNASDCLARLYEFVEIPYPSHFVAPSSKANSLSSAEQFVLAKTRVLNLLGGGNSLNARLAFGWIPTLWRRRAVRSWAALIPQRLARRYKSKQLALLRNLVGGFFCESNAELSRMIGRDLREIGYEAK
jgi:hypothetical protein